MDREKFAREFLDGSFALPMIAVYFETAEKFEQYQASVLRPCPESYTRHGVAPPIPDIERNLILVGFCLPVLLADTEELSDDNFASFLKYWPVRCTIRLAKELELLKTFGDYDLVDEALLEDLVESELQHLYDERNVT